MSTQEPAQPRRVVVTGIGVVSAVGMGFRAFGEALLAGRSGIGPVTLFDASNIPVRVAAEAGEYSDDLLPNNPRHHVLLNRPMKLALVAADDCLKAAGLTDEADARAGASCLVAIGRHEITVPQFGEPYSRGHDDATGGFDRHRYFTRGVRALHPLWLLTFIPNLVTAHISMTFGLGGEANTYTAEGAAALQAIGDAAASIGEGLYDVALCGGCDARVNPLNVARFLALGMLAEGAQPDVSRPFDRKRRGFVVGEGAVFFVLEEAGHARARGATALAEVVGWGGGTDAYHAYLAHPEGRGLERSMRNAIRTARLEARDVDLVVATASSLPDLDAAEATAIRSVFGPKGPLVTAPSGALGRTHAAGGAFAAAVAVVALGAQAVPPTLNTDQPEEGAPAGLVTGRSARPARLKTALANGYAFGGQCASVLFREVSP